MNGTLSIRRILVLAAATLLIGTDAFANGFRNPPEGAAALGRAGGKIAHIDDATAVSHNPANLVLVEQPEVALSITFARSKTEFTSPLGGKDKTDNDVALLPNIHAAFPLAEGDWVFGLGVTTPYGQHTRWEKDSQVAMASPYFAQMSTLNAGPSVATRLNDRVSVGAGLNVYYSELEFRQRVPAPPAVMAPPGRARAKGDGYGVGANAGVTFQLTERQHLAATYRSPFDVDYDGDIRLSNVPLPEGAPAKSDFDTTIKFPSIVAIGYGLKINERIRVGVDVEWVEFSRYRELSIDAGAFDNLSSDIPQRWDDIWTVGVGADWAFAAPWTLRAGYLFMESPIPSETMAPTLPDADRHVLTIGLGYERGGHAFDVAYAYSFFDDREISDNQQPLFNGEYDLSSQLLQVTYRRSF